MEFLTIIIKDFVIFILNILKKIQSFYCVEFLRNENNKNFNQWLMFEKNMRFYWFLFWFEKSFQKRSFHNSVGNIKTRESMMARNVFNLDTSHLDK